MNSSPASASHATIDEVVEALESLSPEDLLRLKQLARLRSATLVVMDWEDLLNESIKRTLDGARLWPRTVPFVAFLAQTIRSVASEERRTIQVGATVTESDLSDPSTGQQRPIDDLAMNEIDPAREVQARQALAEIEAMFANEPAALGILRGLADGSSPEEIQQANGMTPTQYASTQRRIRRSLARRNT